MNIDTQALISVNPIINELSDEHLQVRVDTSKRLKIALITFGEIGHVMPMLRLTSYLEKAGHECTILSNKYKEQRVTEMLKQNELKSELIFPDNVTRDQMLHGWDGQTQGKLTPIMMD